jgi:aminoglycoside phosphotransferase (APT) family kinase protein
VSDTVSRKPPRAVLLDALATHPAVAAWNALVDRERAPSRIEVLRRGTKAATYRLVGIRAGERSVIAQRAPVARATIERLIHERILPLLPVTAPAFYGAWEETPEAAWLFFEDVGDERITLSDPVHLALAGRWVGTLHAGAAELAIARSLPDGGPARYREHLWTALHTIRINLDNPALTAAEGNELARLAANIEEVDKGWRRLEEACEGVPKTLVHGDVQRKNLHVRTGAGGVEVFLIDWETAGWGIPVVDLPKIDLFEYHAVVRANWPDVSGETLRRLAAVGEVFRQLAGIRWVSPELEYDQALYLVRPLSWLRVMYERLTTARHELESFL